MSFNACYKKKANQHIEEVQCFISIDASNIRNDHTARRQSIPINQSQWTPV